MIRAADRFGVEQIKPAFLACGGDHVATLILENYRSDVHVEIALGDPRVIAGRVPIFEFQISWAQRYYGVRVNSFRRIPLSVANFGVDSAVVADGSAAEAPNSAAFGSERFHLLFGRIQIDGPHAVWIPTTALPSGRINHVVDHVQAVRLSVGRKELRGRRHILAI